MRPLAPIAACFALAILPAIADLPPGVPPGIREAISASEAGRKCTALAMVDRWLAEHPGDPGAHVLRGDLLLDCLQGPAAADEFRLALRAWPGDGYASSRLLEALLFSRRYRDAVRFLRDETRAGTGATPPAPLLRAIDERAAHVADLARRRRTLVALVALGWAALLLAARLPRAPSRGRSAR